MCSELTHDMINLRKCLCMGSPIICTNIIRTLKLIMITKNMMWTGANSLILDIHPPTRDPVVASGIYTTSNQKVLRLIPSWSLSFQDSAIGTKLYLFVPSFVINQPSLISPT